MGFNWYFQLVCWMIVVEPTYRMFCLGWVVCDVDVVFGLEIVRAINWMLRVFGLILGD